MILFPNCKINLGLNITRKRPDGFHDLQTFFYPIPITDALEVITLEDKNAPFQFTLSGTSIDASTENICIKVYQLLKKDYQIPPVTMHLHKAIPVGAGLGGGSADGTFTLLLLNKKFNLNLTEDQLLHYALALGSDCPFFIKNVPCIATGRGEVLQPMPLDLSAYKLVLINPGIHINTGWAFSQLQPKEPETPLAQIIQLPIDKWKGNLINDFEDSIFSHHPEINGIKETLYSTGAIYASMSGTGSSVFGIFEKDRTLKLNFPEHYFVKECYL